MHDAEADDLVELGDTGNVMLRVNPALVETDLVVTVTAAETVLHGGPAALLAASGREPLRAAGALSLLETTRRRAGASPSRSSGCSRERVPVIGVSLTLTRRASPGRSRATRTTRRRSSGCCARALRRLFQFAPGRVASAILERLPRS